MRFFLSKFKRWSLCIALVSSGLVAHAVEVVFTYVAPNVYAYVGDTEGRTYDNEALNANFGLVVTPNGAVLIDSGASWQGAQLEQCELTCQAHQLDKELSERHQVQGADVPSRAVRRKVIARQHPTGYVSMGSCSPQPG